MRDPHAHEEVLEEVVPASVVDDEYNDPGDSASGSNDGVPRYKQVKHGNCDTELQRHEPNVMQLEKKII